MQRGARRWSGFGACAWVGAVAALWLLFFGDWTLALLNAPPAVAAIGGPYLPLLALAALLEAYNLVMASILRAHLHARDTLFVMMVMHATHLALALPLMVGVGEWQGLGLAGNALALTVSRALGLALHLFVLGALRSTGDVIFPTSVAITSIVLVLGFGSVVLGQHYGLVGIWIAYVADEWIRSGLMRWRWETHGWVSHARAIQQRLRSPGVESRL